MKFRNFLEFANIENKAGTLLYEIKVRKNDQRSSLILLPHLNIFYSNLFRYSLWVKGIHDVFTTPTTTTTTRVKSPCHGLLTWCCFG